MKILMTNNDINRSMKRIAYEIVEKNHGVEDLVVVGVKNGGVSLAKMLANHLSSMEDTIVPVTFADITPFRDDKKKTDKVEQLDIDINDKLVVIVDDVLFTGRTTRAALECIFSFGRPKKIQLAILVDRGHRQIPIRADYVGKNIPTSIKENVNVVINGENSFVEIN